MTDISTSSLVVACNGHTFEWFKLQRGIRQGDPTPPFVLCIERLSHLVEKAVDNGI